MQSTYFKLVSVLFGLFCLSALAKPVIVQVGSPLVDGNQLTPFSAQWDQFSMVEGQRVKSATYQETLEIVTIDDIEQLKHVQVVNDQSGTQVTNTTYFDRVTLKPLSIEQRMKGVPKGTPDNRTFKFADKQYDVTVIMPDEKTHARTVHMPVNMFNVSNLGLVFAAMPLELGAKYRMPSAFPQYQDGMYWMDVSVSGEKTFKNQDGTQTQAWQVDIHWINIKEGDEYPAGPTKSGGAYYIAKKGSKGIPPVPAYVNDSIAIEVSFSEVKK